MSAKPTPRFGGGGEKCKTCDKTVYPNERISYDNGTWHQLCFKCLSCRSTLSLTAVAMYGGDLYCKTCFKKTFLREGKYSTFDKTQSKEVAAVLTHAASVPTVGENQTSSPGVSRSASVMDGNTTLPTRSASVSIPSHSTAAAAAATPQTPVAQLQAAIEKKDVGTCQSLLAAHGATLLFQTVKSGATVLEWSLNSYMHKATGVKLVEWLEGKVAETNRLVRDNGLVSPLEGSESRRGQVEESKESTEASAEGAEGEAVNDASESNEVEVTA